MHAVLAVLAATLPSVLTMDEALRIFRERGFDLLVAQAQVAAAEGDLRAAGAVANPQLSGAFSHAPGYDASCNGCAANGYSIGLTDPSAISDLITGKRGLRKDVAQAALEAARKGRDDALRVLALQLRQAMLDAALAEAQEAVARDQAESTERTRALDQKRYDAGAISEAELSRAEVAALEAQQAVDAAAQQALGARLVVAFLLGGRDAAFSVDPRVLAEALPAQSAAPATLVQEALEKRPDVLAAQKQRERAAASLSLARRQRIPDISFNAQYAQQGTGASAISPPNWTFGAQLPIPLFSQQQGEIARAEAEQAQQEVLAAKVRAQAATDVQTAHAAAESARKLVERMQSRLLDRARRARDLVQIQYEKGAASLLDLLDAQRTYSQTRAEYLKDLRDFWLATWQLDAAVGRI